MDKSGSVNKDVTIDSQVAKKAYTEALGGKNEAKVGAIHAGLECGLLGEKFPGMNMVSYPGGIGGLWCLIIVISPFPSHCPGLIS